mgnify:CR=1 FL=1
MARKKREKISKESIKKAMRVFRFVKPFKITFTFGMLVLIISSVVMMAFPKVLGNLIDSANSTDGTTVNETTILLIGIFLIIAIMSFFRIYLFGVVTQKSLALLRTETYKHLISSPMSFFSSKRVGELSSRITTDIALLEETFSTTIAEIIRQVITIPVALFFLLFISPRLTVFMISVIPVVALIGIFFGKYIKKLSKNAQDDIAQSNGVVDETLHGIASVKAYANEFFEIARYQKSIDSSVNTSIKNAKWRGAFIGLIMFAAGAAIVSIIWYGLHMVQVGEITIGGLLQFAIYSALLGVSFGGSAELSGWNITFNDIDSLDAGVYSWAPTTNMTNETTLTPEVCPTTTTTYYVTLFTTPTCYDTDSIMVTVVNEDQNILGQDVTICRGDSFQLNANIGTNPIFSPSENISEAVQPSESVTMTK